MSFQTTAKTEIGNLTPTLDCCKRAFLSGFLRTNCKLTITGSGMRVETSVDEEYADKLTRLIGQIADRVEVSYHKNLMTVSGEGVPDFLLSLGIFVRDGDGIAISLGIAPMVVHDECCGVNYIRGAFMGAGSVNITSGYRMEFAFNGWEPARDLMALLARYNITARRTHKKDKHVVYIKESEAVSDTLALLGASEAVLELNMTLADRAFKQEVNRRTNCEFGNITKTVNASVRQTEDINLIADKLGLAALPEKLQVVAKARLDFPDDSFAVLADGLGLSKSTLKNRLNKLAEIADELREKES